MPNEEYTPILQLNDVDNGDMYPITSTEAVIDADGNSLETRLEYIISDADWTAIQARHGR